MNKKAPRKPIRRRGEKAELARKLGITRQLLSYHLRNPSAPQIGDVNGWHLFLATTGRAGTGC